MNASDPLPSWNDSPARAAIIDFVHSVVDPDSPDFLSPCDRIATFDNDGTLWAEQPLYTEMAFLIERVQAMRESHPDWKNREPFCSVLSGDIDGVVAGGGPNLFAMAVEVMDGLGVQAYQQDVLKWVTETKHPRTGRPYVEMTYQPMHELIAWLHSLEFQVFIVSGGTIDFVRPWSEQVYGIARDRVVGSCVHTVFDHTGDAPDLIHRPEMHFVDDGVGKPVGIYQSIGRRPVLACGNSDGDLPMFQWTNASPRAHHCVLIHHTDAEREWAYDADSPAGRLHESLIAARKHGWTIVDMKRDWKQVFAESGT